MNTATPWPAALAGTPAVTVIEQAIARRRLSHSLLLHGDDYETLVAVAYSCADRLLYGTATSTRFPPELHPDCFHLRPSGKARQIRAGDNAGEVGTMREFISKLTVSPGIGTHKVGIVHEADRMTAVNTASANIFLKTLEEPPPNTTLLLLTTRPYALLPTIRSRVLHFRFPSAASAVAADGWSAWVKDYQAWLGRLAAGPATDKPAVADHVFSLYGLVARYEAILEFATKESLKRQEDKFPPDLTDGEQEAIETGIANGIRARLFAEIETATRAFALPRLTAGEVATRRALTAAIDRLEHDMGLLRLNLNVAAVLEDFLLSSLRLWSRRA